MVGAFDNPSCDQAHSSSLVKRVASKSNTDMALPKQITCTENLQQPPSPYCPGRKNPTEITTPLEGPQTLYSFFLLMDRSARPLPNWHMPILRKLICVPGPSSPWRSPMLP